MKSIENTDARVPPTLASCPLLQKLGQRIEQQPRVAQSLLRRIGAIIVQHAAVVSARDRNPALAAIVAIIQRRTQSLDTLPRLHSRLLLDSTQAKKFSSLSNAFDEMQPQMQYIEEDEDEEDEEDEEVDQEDHIDKHQDHDEVNNDVDDDDGDVSNDEDADHDVEREKDNKYEDVEMRMPEETVKTNIKENICQYERHNGRQE